MALSKEVMIIAIALDGKKKIEDIMKEIEAEPDLLKVADLYEDIANYIRKMDADIKEIPDDS